MIDRSYCVESGHGLSSEANAHYRQRQQILAAGARPYNTAVTQRDARINDSKRIRPTPRPRLGFLLLFLNQGWKRNINNWQV